MICIHINIIITLMATMYLIEGPYYRILDICIVFIGMLIAETVC